MRVGNLREREGPVKKGGQEDKRVAGCAIDGSPAKSRRRSIIECGALRRLDERRGRKQDSGDHGDSPTKIPGRFEHHLRADGDLFLNLRRSKVKNEGLLAAGLDYLVGKQ
jgi:hypothetical protein